MGKHARSSPLRSHRKPSAVKATASVAGAAMGTTAIGAIIASSGHSAPAAIPLPSASPAANVVVQVPPARNLAARLAAASWVIVKGGDTLSGISGEHCSTTADWTGIYEANKKTIGGNPNLIQPGQDLKMDCTTANVPMPETPVVQQPVSYQQPASQPVVTSDYGNVNPGNYSGFQQCVIERESGGNSQVMNSSGHYGLYQFSASTWAGHGGNPADFGHASAGEQTQVFWNTVHADGTSDWAPYDGC